MNILPISRRLTAMSVIAALIAATAVASMPALGDTLPDVGMHAAAKADPLPRPAEADAAMPAPAPVEQARTSGLTRGGVSTERQRARAQREVEPGAYVGPYFARSTVRRSVGE